MDIEYSWTKEFRSSRNSYVVIFIFEIMYYLFFTIK